MSKTRRHVRVLAAASLLFLGVAAACAPPPTCPTLQGGSWGGTWSSTDFPGAGGTVDATLAVDGASVTGLLGISGSAVVPSGPMEATIDCANVSGGLTDGPVSFSGTIAPDGNSVSGTYTVDFGGFADHGVLELTRN